jgi:hypothetical protein
MATSQHLLAYNKLSHLRMVDSSLELPIPSPLTVVFIRLRVARR